MNQLAPGTRGGGSDYGGSLVEEHPYEQAGMGRIQRLSRALAAACTAAALVACSPGKGSTHNPPEVSTGGTNTGGSGEPAPLSSGGSGGADPNGIGGTGGGSDTGGLGGDDGLGGLGGEGAGGSGGSDNGTGGNGEDDEPEPEPVCCGCLCMDAAWSCSEDTCVDAEGRAVGLRAEAGFLEIPGEVYVSENATRTSPTHRVWYAFHPADENPHQKPLAVFFNGGPGSATTILFGFNTTVWTLDPELTGDDEIAPNPTSFTQFANTLHIDAPATGFSYALPALDGTSPSVGIDLDRDAGVFVRVILRFLARHPRIQKNPVILVGQSYGGTRATLMLEHTLRYSRLVSEASAYRDLALYEELVGHFAEVFPEEDPELLSPSQVASQFSHQVLIQPVVAGNWQGVRNNPNLSICVPSYSEYQCDETEAWFDNVLDTVAERLTKPAILEQATGVDPTTIAWMYASERSGAYGKHYGDITPTPELQALFGNLSGQDNYYISLNRTVLQYLGRNWGDVMIGANFLDNLLYVRTFITDTRYDMVVWTPAIAPALLNYPWVESSVHDQQARPGVARPGWILVGFDETTVSPPAHEIRFPHYPTAGHGVSMRQPAEFLDDVISWYSEPPASAFRTVRELEERSSPKVSPSPPAGPVPGYVGP